MSDNPPNDTRLALLSDWLSGLKTPATLVDSLRPASADASFRRYFRAQMSGGSCILMDAPPDKENNPAFVQIAQLFGQAGLRVPKVLHWDEPHGFMLLDDLGTHTMMHVLADASWCVCRGRQAT